MRPARPDPQRFPPKPRAPRKEPPPTRQEQHFAVLVSLGHPVKQAAAACGYYMPKGRKDANDQPWQTLKKPQVAELVGQLRIINRIIANVTTESVLRELEEARLRAVALGQPKVEIAATMAKAEVCGLLVDRHAHEHTHNVIPKPSPEVVEELELSPEAWIATWSPKKIDQH